MLQQVTNNTYQTMGGVLAAPTIPPPSAKVSNAGFSVAVEDRLHTARRMLALIPFIVFFLTLALFAGQVTESPTGFAQVIMRVSATTLAAVLVCTGMYGFYRYLQERSYGL